MGEVPVGMWSRPTPAKGGAGKPNHIEGITSETWFGPLDPLNDFAPQDVQGRQWDYPVGYNLLINPRPLEKISFKTLRTLVDKCDIMSIIINNRKDQIESRGWTIKPVEETPSDKRKRKADAAAADPRIKELTEFFKSPDKVNTWDQWLRPLLDDLFVIDAPAVYVRRNRAGGIYAVEVMDGGTISLNIDANGRRPLPPSPAYKQILKGVPAVSYTTDQLIYMPRNLRTRGVFGRSPVEMTMVTINAAINRALFNQNYYVDGNMPDAVGTLPDTFTPAQVAEFTEWWDSQYSGNLSERRKVKFMPGKGNIQQLKEPEQKNVYDDYIARILCFALGISPQPFVSSMNRATAETAKESASEEGKAPIENWVKNLINKIIQSPQYFGYDDLEFDFADTEDQDPEAQQKILSGYVDGGILKINEARERLGEEADSSPEADVLGIRTPTGRVSLDDAKAASDADLEQKKNPPQVMTGVGTDAKGVKPGGSLGADAGHQPKDKAEKSNGSKKKSKIRTSLNRKSVVNAKARVAKSVHNVLRSAHSKLERQLSKELDHVLKSNDSDAERIALGISLSELGDINDSVRQSIEEIAAESAQIIIGQLNITDQDIVDQVNQRAVEWAASQSATLVTQIDEATRNMLQSTISQGLADNIGKDAIIEEIMGVDYNAFSEDRAELIADTEIGNANSQGSLMGMEEAKKSGVEVMKEWDTVEDNCCDECTANSDQGPIPLDETFQSGDDAPLAHPRCRCVLIGITSD